MPPGRINWWVNPAPGIRLQRYLADAGVAARRACERLIEEGRVEVNGQLVIRLPAFVDPEHDRVVVDGRPVPPPGRKVYIALHKPTHTLVTAADEPGLDRRTVLDLVDHPFKARLFPVGRLHYDATGLVLLTNDGEFANRLTHPRYGVTKTYWATVRGTIDDAKIAEIDRSLRKLDRAANRAATGLKAGPRRAPAPDKEDRPHKPKGTRPQVRVVKSAEGKTLLEITMLEARNRQLEDVLLSLGSPVRKVTRVGIGPLSLKGLGLGQWRVLESAEVNALLRAASDKPRRGPEHKAPSKARTQSGRDRRERV